MYVIIIESLEDINYKSKAQT